MKSRGTGWKVVLIAIAIIIAVALMAVFGVQSYKNRAINMEEQVLTAKSDINIQEKRRVDLLGNLVDCVKNYDKHEYETLKAIVDGRSSNDDKATEIKTSIKAVSEAYPELKSNENYKQLMNELATTENLITNYRENYNKQVKIYNAYVRKFPQRMFLDFLGYEKQEYKLYAQSGRVQHVWKGILPLSSVQRQDCALGTFVCHPRNHSNFQIQPVLLYQGR